MILLDLCMRVRAWITNITGDVVFQRLSCRRCTFPESSPDTGKLSYPGSSSTFSSKRSQAKPQLRWESRMRGTQYSHHVRRGLPTNDCQRKETENIII